MILKMDVAHRHSFLSSVLTHKGDARDGKYIPPKKFFSQESIFDREKIRQDKSYDVWRLDFAQFHHLLFHGVQRQMMQVMTFLYR